MLKPDVQRLLATLIVAVPLSGLLWLSGAVSLVLAFGAMMLFVFVVMWAGSLLLRAARAADMPAPAAWVLGLFATALVVYALVTAFQLLAASAFAIWAVLVIGFGLFFPERPPAVRRIDWSELLGLAMCAAASVMWCHEVAAAPEILAREGHLPAWSDHFIHGSVISQFGDALAAGRHSIHLVGFPKPFYHYASYFVPAVFAAPLDLPGLPLSTSLWLPVGFFTMCAGAYALGTALARPAGGIAAIAALALLPDASNYGLHNGFFSFHWNVIAIPGSLYAIGIFLTAMALLQRWSDACQWRLLAAAFCLAGGLVLVRVHLFALGFPALLAAAAASMPLIRRYRLASLAIAALAFTLFVLGFYTLTDSGPALESFIASVHTINEPTAYGGWYEHLLESRGKGVAVPAGMLAVFIASLGGWLAAYAVALTVTLRTRPLGAADRVPIAMVVCYVLLMLTAPTPEHGDYTELTHRPFVLLYASVAVWSAAAFVAWLTLGVQARAQRAWVVLVAASIIGLLVVWPHAAGLARPKFIWGWQHALYKVAPGLPQAAEFLRRNLRRGDVFAVQGPMVPSVAPDSATELTSLTGAPVYLARAFMQMSGDRGRQQAVVERHAALARVADAQNVADALARLRALGIPWYVVAGSAGPRWDADRRRAAFVADSVAVYSSREQRSDREDQ